MPGITRNITKIERDGIKYWTSGAQYVPTTSASSLPQIIGVTCSADTGNNLATTSSLSGYFIIPLVSESISDGTVNSNTIVGSNLNIFYVTASIFDFTGGANTFATASGTPTFFSPTSSNTTVNFNIAVRIKKNETANNVALKTFNAITGSAVLNQFVSASVSASILSIANIISGALHSPPFISASGFSFNYIQSGSFGSGSIPNYKPSLGFLSDVSSSFSIVRDSDDADSIEFSKLSLATNTRESVFYASGSGRIGIKTKDPKDEFDIKVDTFKIRSRDGKKETEFAEGRLLTKKFKGATGVETTGSQLVLTYTPGTFETPTTASVGDILGSITWEDLSIGNRDDATALRIQGKVNAVANDGSAIKGSMRFQIGDSQAGQPINEIAILDLTGFYISGSDRSLNSTHAVGIGMEPGGSTPGNDADRVISFRNNTSNKNWAVGVNENVSEFQIHQAVSLTDSSPDFKIDTSGNITVVGSITAASSNITNINGGSF